MTPYMREKGESEKLRESRELIDNGVANVRGRGSSRLTKGHGFKVIKVPIVLKALNIKKTKRRQCRQ